MVASRVNAQDLPYRFSVDKETVNVYWNSDGTLSLDYLWTFINQPGAHAIDFVDVGMPNLNFDIATAKADVNGKPVTVSKSDYQGSGSGFAIVMGQYAIPAGERGRVHVYVGSIRNVFYNDSKDQNYASVAFAPTYFGSQYVVGNTDITVTFHLPPGVKLEEPRWHDAPSGFPSQPQTDLDKEGLITYTWQNTNANAYTRYQFGASFPKTYIPVASIYVSPTPPPTSRPSSPATTSPAFNITNILNYSIGFICIGILAFLVIAAPIQVAILSHRRKLEYIPPHILIEGHGIKRGLTAVEAGILMEEPLDKIMTMILFGLIKKSAAQVIKRDPLEIKAVDPLPDGLYQYETDFLKAFKDEDLDILPILLRDRRKNLLEDMTVNLVRSVSEKMRGFSRKETVDYYKSIVEKAWQEVEGANTPEVKGQKFDENLEWTMLDKDYGSRTRHVFKEPIVIPSWWNHYDPIYTPPASSSTSHIKSTPSFPLHKKSDVPSSLPGADFAASVVGGVQTFSQKVVGDISAFTEKVTDTTNPAPKPSPSNHSGGGGSSSSGGSSTEGGGYSSCACACACAGCACACAGGGR